MTFCSNCDCSLTTTDLDCGYCTNCSKEIPTMITTFAKIKRGGYFRYKKALWKRTHGRWAVPVVLTGSGQSAVYFDPETEVEGY